jgi:hypothetical protein
MHQKEKVLESLFLEKLGANFEVPKNIDTDIFGTFSGEIKRDRDIKNTLRKKVKLGLEKTGLKLGLASEGSFGAHPSAPFMKTNLETLLFVDLEREIEIFEFHSSFKCTFDYRTINNQEELLEFYREYKSKEQAILIKVDQNSSEPNFLRKGLTSEKEAIKAFEELKHFSQSQSLWVETDMRAHLSKARQAVIFEAGEKLIKRLTSLCPDCHCPGFSRDALEKGLPCKACGIPSQYASKEIWRCSRKNSGCSYEETRDREDGKKSIDPGDCSFCNP